jgi:hypothetical protein
VVGAEDLPRHVPVRARVERPPRHIATTGHHDRRVQPQRHLPPPIGALGQRVELVDADRGARSQPGLGIDRVDLENMQRVTGTRQVAGIEPGLDEGARRLVENPLRRPTRPVPVVEGADRLRGVWMRADVRRAGGRRASERDG